MKTFSAKSLRPLFCLLLSSPARDAARSGPRLRNRVGRPTNRWSPRKPARSRSAPARPIIPRRTPTCPRKRGARPGPRAKHARLDLGFLESRHAGFQSEAGQSVANHRRARTERTRDEPLRFHTGRSTRETCRYSVFSSRRSDVAIAHGRRRRLEKFFHRRRSQTGRGVASRRTKPSPRPISRRRCRKIVPLQITTHVVGRSRPARP